MQMFIEIHEFKIGVELRRIDGGADRERERGDRKGWSKPIL